VRFYVAFLQMKLQSKFLTRPGLLMRRKVGATSLESTTIEEASDSDHDSVHDFTRAVHDSDIDRAISLAEQRAVSFDDKGGTHYALQQPIPVDCAYVTPKDILTLRDHYIIFVWNRNFAQVIEYLRMRHLSQIHSVLLITNEPLSAVQWFVIGRYVGLKVLLGSCSDSQLLIHACADRALGILILPQTASSSSSGVFDSASILIYNMCKKLYSHVPCFIEVSETRSFGFLTKDSSLLNSFTSARCGIIALLYSSTHTRAHTHQYTHLHVYIHILICSCTYTGTCVPRSCSANRLFPCRPLDHRSSPKSKNNQNSSSTYSRRATLVQSCDFPPSPCLL
jgi:hypothetical protein